MDADIDIEALRWPKGGTVSKSSNKPPRHKSGQHFLKGPIPWNWVAKAAKLPGKALHVGICIWYLAGLNRSGTVGLSMARLSELGVSRYAAYRGLNSLERAGLVRAVRCKGRLSRVELVDCV
jgi:hypothetical protein